MIPSNKNSKPFEQKVETECMLAIATEGGIDPVTFDTAAIDVEIDFFFLRPKSHYGTGKNRLKLKDRSPGHNIQKPDVDKLVRAVLDAMTSVAYKDDSQVVSVSTTKQYLCRSNGENLDGLTSVNVKYK